MGLAAAFVFAAQMLNFPIAGGTSGHLLGAVLIAVLLGPGAAVLVLTTVLIVQCLVFADGGLLALGANIFNMGVVGESAAMRSTAVFSGWPGDSAASSWERPSRHGARQRSLRSLPRGSLRYRARRRGRSCFPRWSTCIWSSASARAAVTVLVIVAIQRTRPELIDPSAPASGPLSHRQMAGYGLLISLGLALFVSPFACAWPDGLEKVAAALGFAHHATVAPAPMANYRLLWIRSAPLGTAIAGAVGTLIVFVLAFVVARVVTPVEATESS